MFSWFRWDSLSTKIILWSFVPTAIILFAVALVTLNAYQDVTEDLVLERDRELTRLSASQLWFELQEYIDLLLSEARTANIYNSIPINQRTALAQVANRLAVFDGGVIVLDNFGTVNATLPDRPEVLGQDWSQRGYFRNMLRGVLGTVFSNVVPDGAGGDDVVGIAVPITGPRGEFRGTLFGMFRLDVTSGSAFYGSLVSLRLGQSGNMYLVDGNGRVIYHSNSHWIGSDFSSQDAVQQVLGEAVDAIRTHDLQGDEIVAGFAPVPFTPWGLVTEESWDALTADTRHHRKFLSLLLILGVIVPTFVVTVGVKRIMRPLEKLIAAAQEVARGNFGHTITASSQDEIGKLAEQFNLMSAELQESYTHLEQRVADRTRELSALYEVTAVANESLDLEETLEKTFNHVLGALHAEVGSIQLLDEGGVLHIAIQQGIPSELTEAIERMPQGVGLGYWIIEHNEPLVVADITQADDVTEATRMVAPHAYVGVPVRSKKKILGVLSVARPGRNQFNAEDVALLASIADQVGVAIENARLYEAEQRRADQFRVIGEVGSRITSILAVDELLVEIARLIQEALGYHHIGIGLIEADEVVYKVGAGQLWDNLQGTFSPDRLKVGEEGVSGRVAATGAPLLVEDVCKEPRYVPMKRGGDRIRSELAVPIKGKGKVIGVLDVQSEQPHFFDESDLMVLQSLADQAGIAIENARLYEQAEQAAVMEERGRLARDLHDSVTQSIYSVTLFAEAARRLADNGDLEHTKDYLEQLGESAQQALKELRLLVYELRPSTLEHEGLVGALQHRINTVEERAGVHAELLVEGAPDLPEAVEEALYRVAQEALNNSIKHAGASSVTIELRSRPDSVAMEVRDNGCGFNPITVSKTGGIGMMSMRERIDKLGGTFQVVSSPGQGTQIKCEVGLK